MKKKSEKIIIVGHSGSGKDFLLKGLSEKGLKSSVKFTTRPKRSLEINGEHYNFLSNNWFDDIEMKVKQEFLIEGDIWKYGISLDDFNKSQSFIMTPSELSQIDESSRKNCFVVFLDIDRNVREERLHIREDNNDSISRRLDSDEIDFKDFSDYDLKIRDPNFDIDSILSLMI